MRYKILTVDDSKTVRIIVKKAFRLYDCDILEAANGVEGLAVASKESPDAILLDVTMPVMDGVEMLTRLKSDPALKNVPVVMLTAEGGRDNVLKIAKIGVRDYIVKPFKEDVLIQKVGRIIDLKPLDATPSKAKSILDEANLVVIEDKPAILQQIQDGLRHTPWKVHGMASTTEALDFCAKTPPDLVMVSLSLPDESAFTFFRTIRNNPKHKYTPVFGLVVKTDNAAQQQAQQVGFTALATKPLDMTEVESKIAKAMNLDTSHRYFNMDSGILTLAIPDNPTQHVINEITNYLKPKITEAVDAGIGKAIINVQALKRLDMTIIKVLFQAMQTCRELALHFCLVGNPAIIAECKGFEDTRNWQFYNSLEEAQASLGAISVTSSSA
ncbi:response regulator [Termitidicoccus mucosus]|uniref:Histidine kinase n=1 Tax=Termitidicoccus mucosus TaxID=1184151 RepID=A0A178IEK8_9BACT|nr:histidine kinase [Opitutaceae bacterium TSB47]